MAAAMHSVALWPIRWAPSSSFVSRWRISFDEAFGVPGGHRFAQVADREAADRNRKLGVAGFLFRHPHRGDFREGVDRRRDRRVERLGVAERILGGRDTLGRRRVGQHAAAVRVADRVVAGHVGFQLVVHLDKSAAVGADARAIEARARRCSAAGRWPPARGRTSSDSPVREPHLDRTAGDLHFLDLGVEMAGDAALLEDS